jgi:hypothetical protein
MVTYVSGCGGLDKDQSAALQRFFDDVESVLHDARVSAEYSIRSVRTLEAAYRAALVTRKWNLLFAILADALDALEHSGRATPSSSYRRLRSAVFENADLLPPEMSGPTLSMR